MRAAEAISITRSVPRRHGRHAAGSLGRQTRPRLDWWRAWIRDGVAPPGNQPMGGPSARHSLLMTGSLGRGGPRLFQGRVPARSEELGEPVPRKRSRPCWTTSAAAGPRHACTTDGSRSSKLPVTWSLVLNRAGEPRRLRRARRVGARALQGAPPPEGQRSRTRSGHGASSTTGTSRGLGGKEPGGDLGGELDGPLFGDPYDALNKDLNAWRDDFRRQEQRDRLVDLIREAQKLSQELGRPIEIPLRPGDLDAPPDRSRQSDGITRRQRDEELNKLFPSSGSLSSPSDFLRELDPDTESPPDVGDVSLGEIRRQLENLFPAKPFEAGSIEALITGIAGGDPLAASELDKVSKDPVGAELIAGIGQSGASVTVYTSEWHAAMTLSPRDFTLLEIAGGGVTKPTDDTFRDFSIWAVESIAGRDGGDPELDSHLIHELVHAWIGATSGGSGWRESDAAEALASEVANEYRRRRGKDPFHPR
jgi:hypothetical protein